MFLENRQTHIWIFWAVRSVGMPIYKFSISETLLRHIIGFGVIYLKYDYQTTTYFGHV